MKKLLLASVLVLAVLFGATSATSSSVAAGSKRVPNVVGMNHQEAQDRLQSAGFYNLGEQDCTGKGRKLVFDRNWKVVRQTPKAGKRVAITHRIVLCSKKYSD